MPHPPLPASHEASIAAIGLTEIAIIFPPNMPSPSSPGPSRRHRTPVPNITARLLWIGLWSAVTSRRTRGWPLGCLSPEDGTHRTKYHHLRNGLQCWLGVCMPHHIPTPHIKRCPPFP